MRFAVSLAAVLLALSAVAGPALDEAFARDQLERGLALYYQQRYDVAHDMLASASAALPDDLRAARSALMAAAKDDALDDEAYAAFRERGEAEDAAASDRLLFALAAYLRKDHDDAWLAAHALRDEGNDSAPLHALLSRLHGMVRDEHGELRHARRAHELDPGDPGHAYALAALLRRGDDPARAAALLERALEAWPTHLDATLLLADLHASGGRKDAAAAMLARARALAPDSSRVRRERLEMARDQGHFEEWLSLARAAADEAPDDVDAVAEMAYAYSAMGRPETAIAVVEEGLRRKKGDRLLLRVLDNGRELAERERAEPGARPAVSPAPETWPPALADGEAAVVILAEEDNDWTGWLETEVLGDAEVAEALVGVTVTKAGAGHGEIFAALQADARGNVHVPSLVVAGPDGRVLGRVRERTSVASAAATIAGAIETAASLPAGGGAFRWRDGLEAALAEGRETRRPVMAYFPADDAWGGRMDETLADPSLAVDLSRVVPVTIAADRAGEFTASIRPSVVFLDAGGRVLKKAVGYRRPDVLRDDIEKAVERAADETEHPTAPDWLADVGFALDLARSTERQIVMDIYTDWCGPCREMDRTTFADAGLQETLSTLFVPVKMNPEVNTEEGPDWDTFAYPTNYLISADGVILKEVERRDPEGYVADLEAAAELATLREIGEEAYRDRQRRRRYLRRLLWNRMPRSALSEAEKLIAEGETGLESMLAWALGDAGDREGAAAVHRGLFEEAESPTAWQASMTVVAEEAGARASELQTMLPGVKGRRAHEAALWLAIGQAQREAGDYPAATGSVRKSLRLGAGGEARIAAAELAIIAGDAGAARAVLDPDAEDGSAMEHVLLAWMAQDDDDAEAVLRHAEAAMAMDEAIGRRLNWRADGAARSNDPESPASSEPFADAERWYRLAARTAPLDDASTLNDIGYTLAEEDLELDLAVDLLRRAVALEEESGEASEGTLDSLAWALHRRGDHEEALEVMRRAVRAGGALASSNETFCYHLGAIYGAMGLTGLACEELEKVALGEAPADDDESEAAEARRLLDRYRPPTREPAPASGAGM